MNQTTDIISVTAHRSGIPGQCNSRIIIVGSLQGPGGAPTRYDLATVDPVLPEAKAAGVEPITRFLATLHFQNGDPNDPAVGINGVTSEALLAVVADRLTRFSSGPFPSRENSIALTKVEEALHRLHDRTRERAQRGVEGQLVK